MSGIFIHADDRNCFTVKHDNFNIWNDAGACVLFALVDPALQGFCLNFNPGDLAAVAYPDQYHATFRY